MSLEIAIKISFCRPYNNDNYTCKNVCGITKRALKARSKLVKVLYYFLTLVKINTNRLIILFCSCRNFFLIRVINCQGKFYLNSTWLIFCNNSISVYANNKFIYCALISQFEIVILIKLQSLRTVMCIKI